MSPRRARRREDQAPPILTGGLPDTEHHPDGEWRVRPVSPSDGSKSFRCPGCDQLIAATTAHLVAWRPGSEDDRRHWHTPCWRARDRRAADVQRSRNAPRYG